MFQLKYDTSEYFDFKLVYDREDQRKLGDWLEVDINLSDSLISSVGKVAETSVTLPNITLNGLDNRFITNGLLESGEVDHTIQYVVNAGDHFEVWPVSGYSESIIYDINPVANLKKLNGGFYQGFFKLHDYPVEYFNVALSKGWTANLTLFHNPSLPLNLDSSKHYLNEIFPDNAGFIFYLGTRAENKYNDVTDVELAKIKENYNVDFGPIRTTLYTHGEEFTLSGATYTGRYNYTDGQYWTGYEKTDTSERLVKDYKYEDITNNAFGIRITPDGRIGYRLMTDKTCDDKIVTGDTTTPGSGVDGYLWVDVYDCKTDTTFRKLVTPKYKIVEQYTKLPVMNDKLNKYANITVTFERYFPVTDECMLKFTKFRLGTLKIFLNGIKVLTAHSVSEIFPRELDTVSGLQEAVPYILSIGGGTQGLYEAVYLDPEKKVDGVLEKYFAGTYTGSVKRFNFYTTPASVIMVRDKTRQVLNDLNIPITFGGRKIILY